MWIGLYAQCGHYRKKRMSTKKERGVKRFIHHESSTQCGDFYASRKMGGKKKKKENW